MLLLLPLLMSSPPPPFPEIRLRAPAAVPPMRLFDGPVTPLPPSLVLNEVEYNDPGADNEEFVEIKNVSGGSINLADYSLRHIDGIGGATLWWVQLSGTLPAGDWIVGDPDGVILVPADIAAEVARDTLAYEQEEEFILRKIRDGAGIYGTYPLAGPMLEEYRAERAAAASA